MFNEAILRNTLKAIKDHPDLSSDIIDSFSDNQFNSKKKILDYIEKFLQKDFEIAILGCWYGSILIPRLAPYVKKIIAIDLNDTVVRIGKNKLFKHYNNITWSTGDIFKKELDYSSVNLVINTSCEHMRPMKEWPYWPAETYFALTSNNMNYISGHINCVDSLDEFKNQLPNNAQVLFEDQIEDERGTRFLLIGKISVNHTHFV